MITDAEKDQAIDQVHYVMIDELKLWMDKEKNNLDGFLANPEGHVDYSPFVTFDFEALKARSTLLGDISSGLDTISKYKQNDPNVTRTMHDYALDQIPHVVFERIVQWIDKRVVDMEQLVANGAVAPIPEYEGFATINVDSIQAQIDLFKACSEGYKIVIQYKKERL